MTKRRCQAAFTLIEMLVVISIIAIMISLTVPAVNVMVQSHRTTSAQNLIRTALAQAQAYAVKEHKYAGLRFQQDGAGRQYIILVEAKRIELTNFYPGGNSHPLMTLYTPVDNVLPVALPEGIVLLNASYVYIDCKIDQIIEDWELDESSKFCILFSPSGQLVRKPAQCGPRISANDYPGYEIPYNVYTYAEGDTIFENDSTQLPPEGLPLPGDEICVNNNPRPVKDSQTGLLLYNKNQLETMNPEERFYFIFNADGTFNQVRPMMINIYTGKLIAEE